MKRLLSPAAIALLAVVVVGIIVWSAYNWLVGLDEGVTAAWSQVENVYQRRADLIPNLVKTVEGARNFEQETLQHRRGKSQNWADNDWKRANGGPAWGF